MNKKGFAVSTMLYGLVFVTVAIFFTTIAIAREQKEKNESFVEEIRNNLPQDEVSVSGGSGETPRGLLYANLLKTIDNYEEQNDEEGNTLTVYFNEEPSDEIPNYVWYSGKLWRVISISRDGSMKMITDDIMTTLMFGDNSVYSPNSWIYKWLNEDFKSTLYNVENVVINDYGWNATTVSEYDSVDAPDTYPKRWQNIVKGAVGLLNYYEYAKFDANDGYLYSSSSIDNWLLTSFELTIDENEDDKNDISVATMYDQVNLSNPYQEMGEKYGILGVKPVVVLKWNTAISGGVGTKNDPYRIIGDIPGASFNSTPLNKRVSGEYVKFDNKLFRIVSTDDNSTKLIMISNIEEDEEILEKYFSTSSIYGNTSNDDNYWDYYLNNTWLNSISSDYREMMVEGTYYVETYNYQSYKATICKEVDDKTVEECEKTTATWKGYVGLPRVGEMFAAPLNEDDTSWFLTPYNNIYTFKVDYDKLNKYPAIEDEEELLEPTLGSVHPMITLSNKVVITSGNGRTSETPFEISLAS